MVTKQQQLEWLAKNFDFDVQTINYVIMSGDKTGLIIGSGTSAAPESSAISTRRHIITRQEWQQERDKMKQQPAQPVPGNSWYERGEFPPVGCECQFFSDGYDAEWFDWCIFHGKATCGGLIIEHHHRTSPSRVTVELFDPLSTNFRPLRTEREKAIDEMIKLIGHGYMSAEMAKELAIKMYDAGYHK